MSSVISSKGSGGDVNGIIHQPTGSFNSTIDASKIAGTRSCVVIPTCTDIFFGV